MKPTVKNGNGQKNGIRRIGAGQSAAKETAEMLRIRAADLTEVIFPRFCAVCGRRLDRHESHLCIYCAAEIPFTDYWNRRENKMADRLNSLIQKDIESIAEECGAAAHEQYSYAAALFFYRDDSGFSRIPQKLKYHGDLKLGRHFGAMLGARLAQSALFSDVDMVIPVPLHWARRWRRGYNQAAVLGRETAAKLGTEMREDILVRHRRTGTQTKLGTKDKMRNVEGAFKVRDGAEKTCCEAGHILLIDDVFTSGATIRECHRALREKCGPGIRISAATLAFVEGP